MNKLFVVLMMIVASCSTKHEQPHIEIQTKFGDIELELYPNKAPKTVAAILLYVKAGYYKNSSFYRVLNNDNQPSDAAKAELIQGGLYRSKAFPDVKGIPHETTQQTGLKHTNGVVSMARLQPGTATTEFFICLGDQPGFDYGGENNPDKQGYAAFGKVVKGMDVVRKIYNQREDEQAFDPPIPIYNIVEL